MQSILNQAKNDPAALQNHMQNATIRTKIQKVSIDNNLFCHGSTLTITTVDRGWCDPSWAVMEMSEIDDLKSICMVMLAEPVISVSLTHAFSETKEQCLTASSVPIMKTPILGRG